VPHTASSQHLHAPLATTARAFPLWHPAFCVFSLSAFSFSRFLGNTLPLECTHARLLHALCACRLRVQWLRASESVPVSSYKPSAAYFWKAATVLGACSPTHPETDGASGTGGGGA